MWNVHVLGWVMIDLVQLPISKCNPLYILLAPGKGKDVGMMKNNWNLSWMRISLISCKKTTRTLFSLVV